MAKAKSSQALVASFFASGAIADELLWAEVGTGPQSIGATGNFVDERILPEGKQSDYTYTTLHKLRGYVSQAVGLLEHYAPNTSPALRGELYALKGYAELQLAELFCSGVPLSTLDFERDFTYRPSSTTQEVLAHARDLEDTALALSGDSARALNLARVLKGRALLSLGQYDEAARAVEAVPDTFRYDVPVTLPLGATDLAFGGWTVADEEGGNGLPFVSGGDSRVRISQVGVNLFGRRLFTPDQYMQAQGTSRAVLASGVEARLIEAEAALHAGDASWLTALNTLRTSGPVSVPADTLADTLGVTGCATVLCGAALGGNTPAYGQPAAWQPGGFPAPAGYSFAYADTTYPAPAGIGGPGGFCDQHSWYRPCYAGDSMVVLYYVRPASTGWAAGTGAVAGLAPLVDPGAGLSGQAATDARVDLLFAERAYWLFLTGHRQGDLRRLVRAVAAGGYGRRQDRVYPTGPYYGGQGTYGSDVTLPIPQDERVNPLFHGCLDRGA